MKRFERNKFLSIVALVALSVGALAAAAGRPAATRRSASPADFYFLNGAWHITYSHTAMTGPPLRGTWIWRSDNERAISEELRLFGPAGDAALVGVTYRIHDSIRRQWDVGHVVLSTAHAIIAPYAAVGTRADATSWRDASGLHVEERGNGAVLRMTFSEERNGRVMWKADLFRDDRRAGPHDRIEIVADRATPD